MLFKVNHAEGEAKEFPLVENGKYEVTVTNAELKNIGQSNEQISVTFEIRSDIQQKFGGQKLFGNFPTPQANPKMQWKLQQLVTAAGFPNDMVITQWSDLTGPIVTKNLVVEVKQSEYQGKTYANVDKLFPSESPKGSADQTFNQPSPEEKLPWED